ncbi:MAG: hypothetical protein RJB66_741 [Pseudomonadota bacterium]
MNSKWFGIGAIASFLLMVFLLGQKVATQKQSTGPIESESFINYVIPKLKTFIPKFSLWDRKFIDRRKLAPKSPETGKVPVKPAVAAKLPTPVPTPKVNPTAMATPTPAPAPTSNQASADARLNEAGKKDDDFDLTESNPYGGSVNNLAPMPSDIPTPEAQMNEWKLRILRSPTKETLNELVFEFQTGKIERAVFYQVVSELLQDSNTDFQRLGIYALASTPSYDSLYTLLNYKDRISGGAQNTLRITLESYAKPDKINIVSLTLRSDTRPVVLETMPLVIKMSKQVKLWSTDQSSTLDDRTRRGPHTRVPKNGFMEIVEILHQLEDSNDRQIAQSAHDTLNQLTIEPSFASRRD